MMPLPSIKILIADDHQILAEGLAQNLTLADGIEVVGIANNGYEVITELENGLSVDVILLDIDMPIMDGFATTKALQKKPSDIKIIALSMHTNVNYVKKIMKEGAHGYMLKDATQDDIVKAIFEVQAGKKVIDQNIAQKLILSSDADEPDFIPILTRREKEILQLIAAEKTNQEISKELFVSLSTVEFHRKNLLRKFDARNSVGLVKAAMEFDLIS